MPLFSVGDYTSDNALHVLKVVWLRETRLHAAAQVSRGPYALAYERFTA